MHLNRNLKRRVSPQKIMPVALRMRRCRLWFALGYSSSEALRALNGIEITEETDVEEILKMALKNMAFL